MVGKSLVVGEQGIITEGMFNEFAGELKIVDLELPELKYKGTQIGASLKKKGYQFDIN